MRFAALLASTLLLTTAACAVPGADEEDRASATSDLVNGGDYSACSLSRSSILASTSPARQRAIQRGFAWLDTNVQYSQSASHQGYRTDCSGFVSMCWELGSSPNTASFMAGSGKATQLRSFDDLIPGDAFIRSGHAALFLGWEDDARTSACIIELASTASDMKFRSRKTSALQSSGTKAFRADYLSGDMGLAQGATTEDEDEPTPTPPPPPATNDDPPANDDPPTPTPPPSEPDTDTEDDLEGTPPGADDTEDSESYEVPLEPSESEGDPGDDYEPQTTRKRSRDNSSAKALGNAGCSAAPGSAAGSGLPILGALFAANVIARRARRRPNA
ncbi:MAG: hypothetical protein KF894_28895 [Labilithrix sp.]|nr:hypothetical protein [Labilithrix sp.]